MKLRTTILALAALAVASAQNTSGDAFDRMKALAGTWEADSPAGGILTAAIALASQGTAIMETIGTPDNNEVSLYTRADGRIVMTHYCAMSPGGNQPRLEANVTAPGQNELVFAFVKADNLSSLGLAHMQRMVLRFRDASHFTETWTKQEKGKDTVFTLQYTRRATH